MPGSIKSGGAAELTARHLEDLILEGSLRPGEALLAEREMALRLEVSRPTLRQSLKKLEDKGLIIAAPDGGRTVAPLLTSVTDPLMNLIATRPEMVDNYLELRENLERMAASLAAERASDLDRKTLRACVDRIAAAHAQTDPRAEAEADVDLHLAVYEASHNVVLLQIMRALSAMLRQGVFLNRDKLYAIADVRSVLRDQHIAIAQGILDRNPQAAGDAAANHMVYTRRVLGEIAMAEGRLELSLRRINGGNITVGTPRSTAKQPPKDS
jgi:GntR family transcriptional repressor for pyruvate dehydrogenase complex